MPELRQDPTTYDWVIVAKERSRLPEEFKNEQKPKAHLPDYSKYCPFCPGNEGRTPRAEAVCGDHGRWRIRVVPNKFPALTPDGTVERKEHKLFRAAHGYGRHEVIIETPLHNEFLPFMTDERVEEVLKVYRDRYHALKGDPDIKVIIIFKNHGQRAGTSLIHPHTQIVTSPIVPPFIRRKFEIATQYFDIIHSSPVDDEHKSYYLWHIQIIPRLTEVAGFELGSGIYINSALPEETAAFMRGIKSV